jgi:hypothetical protein
MTDDLGKISDGYHTFHELYEHRAALFIALMKTFPEISWYSKRHEQGGADMFDGMFIAGMDLPTGQVTYHLNLIPWWTPLQYSKVEERTYAPEWDGHNSDEVIVRINSCDLGKLR